MSDPCCQICGEPGNLENGVCFPCRLLQAGSQETIQEESSGADLPNPRRMSPEDLVHRVAEGLKEPNDGPFQETFQSPDVSDHTPAPVPSTVETARRERPESVSGKFTMVEKVGTGGAGDVWKAWDESIHRWVALKFLKNEEEFNLQLFRREARMVGRLSHPHIIPIHEMGILGKHHYIAMRFVEGATLREYIRQDVGLIAGLMRDAAEALQYAHENDVIHRDIKPTNFLVEEQSSTRPTDTPPRTSRLGHHIYVADFGLAKQVSVDSALSISGNLIGTPAYMSPEQANGESEAIDFRTDIYSLGATLYELLFGHPPFTGNTIYDLLKAIVEEDPPSLRKKYPGIDRDLETIVMKCLRKDPADRYQSAGDLAEDLDCYLQHEPLKHARPVTFGYRMRKRIQKQPLLWSVTAALVLSIFLGGGWGISSLISRARMEREGRDKVKMDAIRTQALVEARRALQWGGEKKMILSLLTKAKAETNPDSVWLSEAGRLLYETNDKEMKVEARTFLIKAATLDKERAFEALYYLHLIEDEGKNTHDSPYLQEIRRRAEALGERDNPFVLIMRCDEAIESGADDLALELADRAVQKGKNIFDTWNHRGMAKAEKGDYIGAIEDHTKAIDLSPNYVIAWNQRGLAKSKVGNLVGATVDYNRALDLNPDFYPAWNNRAMIRMQKGDIEGAISDYTRALEIYPEYVHAWNNRGNSRLDQNDFDGAIADLTRALELDPLYVFAWNNRGNAKRGKRDFDGAIADYGRALEIDPQYVKAWSNRGIVKNIKRDFDGAIADCKRALQIDPKYANAWDCYGQTRMNQGDIDGAIADFTRAIKYDPKMFKAWESRGDARRAKGDLDGAIEDYTRAVEVEPKYVSGWNSRGNARKEKEDFEGAIADYTQALQIDPVYVHAWNNRGLARAGKGDHQGAIEDYSKAIAIRPEYFLAWNNRGISRQAKGDNDGAIEDYTHGLQLDPENFGPWYNRGLVHLNKGNLTEAIADYTRAAELDPEYFDVWYHLGLVRMAQGDFEGAIRDYTRSINLKPKYLKAWINRGISKKNLGEYDGAIEDYSRVIEIDPGYPNAWYNRGISKKKKGDDEGALSDWEQFLKLAPEHSRAPAIREAVRKIRTKVALPKKN